MNIIEIRDQFPLLKRKINEKEIVYLDNAATSLKPQCVIDSIVDYYSNYSANIHRGIHLLSEESSIIFDEARSKVARFINAQFNEVIFVRNTTEAINLVRFYPFNDKRNKVITTISNHHSNLLPWHAMGEVDYLLIDATGKIDLHELEEKIDESISLVAVNHISNITGVVNPIKKIIDIAHKKGAKVLIDAAQSISHRKIDVKELDCDFLVFSGHKMFGPTGVGVLYAKNEILQKMEPIFVGGGMVKRVSVRDSVPENLPQLFEAGTPHIAGVIGLGEAVDFINRIGMDAIVEQNKEVSEYLIKLLLEIEEIEIYPIYNKEVEKIGIVSFRVKGFKQDDIASILSNRFNIMVRSGVLCAEPLMNFWDIDGVLRVSISIYNTKSEVDLLIDALKTIIKLFPK